ncbi:hypothetical protein HDU98_006695 [Podochytrium sp. JEL0797]|nr:hypothetical protein HDU98_006695 [Podochytrium sp. JEL0797]
MKLSTIFLFTCTTVLQVLALPVPSDGAMAPGPANDANPPSNPPSVQPVAPTKPHIGLIGPAALQKFAQPHPVRDLERRGQFDATHRVNRVGFIEAQKAEKESTQPKV